MSKIVNKIKKAKANRPARTTRPQVVSFRITSKQTKLLKEIFDRDSATGVNSPNQLARKVLCDYLAGRLDYRNPDDKLQDLDSVGATA
jgi:hypothetical protein